MHLPVPSLVIILLILSSIPDLHGLDYEIVFELAPTPQNPLLGTDALIECIVSGPSNMVISWRHDGVKIITGDRYTLTSSGLQIQDIRQSDDGEYSCRAEVLEDGYMKERKIWVEVYLAPEVTLPEVEEGIEGSFISISCYSNTVPAAEYTFTKDGFPVVPDDRIQIDQDRGRLIFNPGLKEDEGIYTCVATNAVGTDSGTTVLFVIVSPKITELFDVAGLEANHVTMVCVAEGDPEPSITFQKVGNEEPYYDGDNEGGRIVIDKVSGNELRMTITSLQLEDTGNYTCAAHGSGGEASEDAMLVVEYRPRFEKSWHDGPVYGWPEAFDVGLICEAAGEPEPHIQWYHDDQLIEEGSEIPNRITSRGGLSLLEIRLDMVEDEVIYGDYKCLAMNTHGSAFEIIELRRATLPEVSMPDVAATEGSVATLKCLATADPRPTYTFFKNNVPLEVYYSDVDANNGTVPVYYDDARFHVDEVNGSVIINPVQRSDEGHYNCQASNLAGSATDTGYLSVIGKASTTPSLEPTNGVASMETETYQQEFDIDSKCPGPRNQAGCEHGPLLQPRAPDTIYYEEDATEVMLTCDFSSNPDVYQYEWYFEGELVGDDGPDKMYFHLEPDSTKRVYTNNTLVILNPFEENEGFYQCVATNVYGSVSENPIILKHGYLLDFPRSERDPVQVDKYAGVGIECNPPRHNYPYLIYIWYHNDIRNILETEDEIWFISRWGRLYFSSVTEELEGYHNCIITSPDNEDMPFSSKHKFSMPIGLRIRQQAFTEHTPYISKGGSAFFPAIFPSTPLRGQEVNLECFAYGTGKLYYVWGKVDDILPRKAKLSDLNRVLTIPDVQPSDVGEYKCTVINEKGDVDEASVVLEIEALPDFEHTNQYSLVEPGQILSWSCSARGTPDITSYEWYVNSTHVGDPGDSATDPRVSIKNNMLEIQNVSTHDEGMYQCAASNALGTRYNTLQLWVTSDSEEKGATTVTDKDIDVSTGLPDATTLGSISTESESTTPDSISTESPEDYDPNAGISYQLNRDSSILLCGTSLVLMLNLHMRWC